MASAAPLQWHFTFMWFFAVSGVGYVVYQVARPGTTAPCCFTPRDIPGVWPMARHYFFFGPKPPATGQYNPLQKKLAYTSHDSVWCALRCLPESSFTSPPSFRGWRFYLGGFI